MHIKQLYHTPHFYITIYIMKFIIPIFLLLSVTTCTLANTTGEPRHVLFTRTSDVPEGFVRGKATPKDTTVTFNVALKGANKNVEQLLSEVSDIEHEKYGNYLTIEELRERSQAPLAIQSHEEMV